MIEAAPQFQRIYETKISMERQQYFRDCFV